MHRPKALTYWKIVGYIACFCPMSALFLWQSPPAEFPSDVPAVLQLPASSLLPQLPQAELDVCEFTISNSDEESAVTHYLISTLGDAGELYLLNLEMLADDQPTFPQLKQHQTHALADFIMNSSPRTSYQSELHSARKIPLPNPPEPSKIDRPRINSAVTSRTFFLQTGTQSQWESSYQPLVAELVAETDQIQIWRDTTCSDVIPREEFARWAESLEQDILPGINHWFGEIADLDGTDKLAVCVTPRLSELSTRTSPVHGLVQVNDFQPDLPRPFSNQADVIFVTDQLQIGPKLSTILTHEAAHLALFSRRQEVDPLLKHVEDDWLSEGLAHFAEQACTGDWSNLEQRLIAFAEHSATSPLVVTDAARQGLWRHPGSRGAAWLFLAWLAEEFGPDCIRDLATHPQVGREKLESLTGQSFETLFRNWTVAIWRAHAVRSPSMSSPSIQSQLSLNKDSEPPLFQQVAYRPEVAVTSSPLMAGIERGGAPVLLELTQPAHGQPVRHELSLRGTSLQICRGTLAAKSNCRVRISAPKACRLQVTLVRETPAGPEVILVK